jgi:hypothetical protein
MLNPIAFLAGRNEDTMYFHKPWKLRQEPIQEGYSQGSKWPHWEQALGTHTT